MLATDLTRYVAVGHVVDLTNNLESVVHGTDHVIQTIGHQFHLFAEFGIAGQGVHRDGSELDKDLLETRSILE